MSDTLHLLPDNQTRDFKLDLKTVLWFVEHGMLEKLFKHRRKSNWLRGEDPSYFIGRIGEEFDELCHESVVNLDRGDSKAVVHEAGDVANFSMMRADVERDAFGEPLQSDLYDCIELLRRMLDGSLPFADKLIVVERARHALQSFDDKFRPTSAVKLCSQCGEREAESGSLCLKCEHNLDERGV